MTASAFFRLFAGVWALLSATCTACGASANATDAAFTVSEQAARNTVIGQIDTAPLETETGEIAFDIIGGNTDEVFHIDGRTGVLLVARPERLDYESRARYELTIRVKQASSADAVQRRFAADLLASNVDPAAVMDLFTVTAERRVTVDVLDVNEPPVISSQSLTLISDVADSSAAVGLIGGIDPDHNDSLTYEVIAGDPAGLLTLDGSTGRLAITPGSDLPAGQQVVPLTVRVTDQAGLSDAATVSVRLVGIPVPQIAQALSAADVVKPTDIPPAEDPAPSPAGHPETPIAATKVAAGTATTPPPRQVAAEPRQFARPALWFFLAGVLLGSGIMTVVFRYVGRTSLCSTNRDSAPRDPFGQVWPQPIVVSTREQWEAIRPTAEARSESSRGTPAATPGVMAKADASSADASQDSEAQSSHTEPPEIAEPESTPEPAVPARIPHWRDALRFGTPHAPTHVEPASNDAATARETDDASVAEVPVDGAPDDHDLPLQPPMSDSAEAWSAPASAEEAPQLLPPVEGGWYSPPEYLVEELPEHDLPQQAAAPSGDLYQSGAVDDDANVTQDMVPLAEPPIHAPNWSDGHDTAAVPEAWQPQDDLGLSGAMQEGVADSNDVYDVVQAPEPADELNDVPELPATSENWIPTHDLLQGDAAEEVADAIGDVQPAPLTQDAATTADGDYVPPEPDAENRDDDVHEAAAVREAAETLEESGNPLGVEPRVAELRRQLTELFGVRVDRPAADQEAEPVPERETSIAFNVVKEVASDSARVDGLFESLRFNLEGQAEPAGDRDRSSDTDAVIVNLLPPEDELARSGLSEPAVRVNKSAMRQEISSLREVANSYARAIVAREETERRTRLEWLVSAGCMVPLFTGGTYLLTSMSPGIVRWLGWLLLTAGAAAFWVCLNSFNRLSKLHGTSQADDDSDSQRTNSPHDTAEFDVPPELLAEDSRLVAGSLAAAQDSNEQTSEPEPAEVGAM